MTYSARRLKFSPRIAVAVLLTLAAGLWLTAGSSARAAQSLFASTLNNEVSIVSDVDSVAPGTPFHIGLLFGLGKHWHIYWTNPGDAGVAPAAALTLPQGGSAGPIQWPIPKVIYDGPVTSYGYSRKLAPVLLPLTITPPGKIAGAHYSVKVAASWLVCNEICVPGQATFSLALPVEAKARPSHEAPLFAEAERDMPHEKNWHGWIEPDGTLTVDGTDASRDRVASAYFFPAGQDTINQDYFQPLKMRQGRLVLGLKLASDYKADKPLAGLLVLTAADGSERAAMITATPGMPPVAMPGKAVWMLPLDVLASARYLSLIGAALLGGLILNLMPCVFPVLAMKAAHLAHLGDGQRGRAQRDGLVYGLGILVSFLALAVILFGLREGGTVVGWGFQFQSPDFVLVITWLLFAVGLSFSGVLTVGNRWMGLGQSLTQTGGVCGSFFSGVLAAVVATPCTAPFMGAAMAAALAGPPLPGLLIFAALGIGLALPMVVLSCIPGIGRLFPRPGQWMIVLHQALAFPIYASVLWLIWVASQEGGSSLLVYSGIGLLLIAFAAWAWRLGGRVAPALAVIAAAILLPVLWEARSASAAPASPSASVAEAFTTSRLNALRAAGKPVFVNLTAAWCVTCLVNDRLALGRADVQQGFRQAGVTYLVGDWTRADPQITAFLKEHGRSGVPLYVYYPPGDRQPVVLPQILTPTLVLTAIGAAAG
ncbi:thioredoxin family protein [Acidisoma cellulosilytica]|uniref:Thioredoxin family protein n=1 Tax=Acidisoma cellulosilyticum TaxID=2802395 RepID=A0A963Z0G9_9PROT|nr:protein-disulfide reductase DsbD domain-containing protein [Acidisoma cellulosilyticum]MCB8880301.1 thioredoxin family protein [Acidisoma cellulosilyticum]